MATYKVAMIIKEDGTRHISLSQDGEKCISFKTIEPGLIVDDTLKKLIEDYPSALTAYKEAEKKTSPVKKDDKKKEKKEVQKTKGEIPAEVVQPAEEPTEKVEEKKTDLFSGNAEAEEKPEEIINSDDEMMED